MKNNVDTLFFTLRGLRRSAANLRRIPSPNITNFKTLICKVLQCDFASGVSAPERFDMEVNDGFT